MSPVEPVQETGPASGVEALLAAARLMWPEPSTVRVVHGRAGSGPREQGEPGGSGARRQEFLLVPNAADPKLVVPASPAAAAATVARSATAPGSAQAAARTAVLAAGLRSGAGARLLRDRLVVDLPAGAAALDAHLADVLGRDVRVGLRVGPPRANRKPVLQVVTPHGELVAYAKLGVNPLTDTLVDAEADALGRLHDVDLGEVRIPSLLHRGSWQGHPLVVQAALPVRRSARGEASSGRVLRAMTVVAGAEGVTRQQVRELPWWERTAAVVAALPDSTAAHRLATVGAELVGWSDEVVAAGAWHGDWNPGNCAVLPDAVLVWDWERYEAGVPVGFDALHLHLQAALGAGVEPLAAAGRLVTDAADVLTAFPVGGSARLVSMLYLYGLGARYLHDDQAGAGAAVGRLESWLLPTLEQSCAAMTAAGAQRSDHRSDRAVEKEH